TPHSRRLPAGPLVRIWQHGFESHVGSSTAETELPSRFDLGVFWEYLWGMKVKTSVTFSPTTLSAVDEIAGETSNRSRVIEMAVLEFVERHRRTRRDARDLEILNLAAEELNEETKDILAYQAEL
ncbi:MAG: hypothetical protein MPN21_17345, partial [Thermoanaerobaculia bacterium]|nr:hypothetical protein [Thermoanaerobaculia bacterium]